MFKKIFQSSNRRQGSAADESDGSWAAYGSAMHPGNVDQDAELAMRLAQEELDAERHKGSPSAWEGLYPPIFPQAPSPPQAEEAQPIDDLEEALRQSSMHAERLEAQRRLALESDQVIVLFVEV